MTCRPACKAWKKIGAMRRSSVDRNTLRELIARPSCSLTGWADDNADRKIQILDQLPHDPALLIVFLSKNARPGRTTLKSLVTTVATPAK